MKTKKLFLFLFLFLFYIVPNQSYSNNTQTIRINIGNEPPTLDWNLATDSTSFQIINNIMGGLTKINSNNKKKAMVTEKPVKKIAEVKTSEKITEVKTNNQITISDLIKNINIGVIAILYFWG